MKLLFAILLLTSSQIGFSQKIDEIKFDRFDSIYTVSTKNEILVGKKSEKKYFYFSTTFYWLKKAKFIESPKAKFFSLLIAFRTDISTSTDNETEIKIEFVDGTFGVYKRPSANFESVTDMGFFNFTVPLDDKLFTTDIKIIRIATSDTNIDYEIPPKKASYIKNALILTKSESEKLL